MNNRPEDILWSLEMIKRAANSPNGCTIKMKEQYKAQSGGSEPSEKEIKKLKIFNEYWSGKSMKKNE